MRAAPFCLAGAFGAAAFRGAADFFGSPALLFLAAVVFVVVARERGLDALFRFVAHLRGAEITPVSGHGKGLRAALLSPIDTQLDSA
ncbi:hypothetical protein WME95_29965 [Sorangium sp. So ce327]|uniref:hypothetical protein n=1 Tax=Sorangium sp. So ce327 TaxID=3133301 RepID=UPI003F60B9B6